MSLNDLLPEDATLNDLPILADHPFDVDAGDFSLIFHIGQKQRDESKNEYDYSVESTVFLFYTYHKLHLFGVPEDTSRLFLNLITHFQCYFFSKQRDRKLSDDSKLKISSLLAEIKASRNPSTIGYVLRESRNHFLSAMKDIADIEEYSLIEHINDKMLNAICGIELFYERVVGDYF